MPATIKDLVKSTNLSLGTISKYLNGQRVKDKNRETIESAIRELNYSVNEFGRCLKTNKSKTIGIVMPYLDDPYAAKIAAYAARILRGNNYAVITSDITEPSKEKDVIDFMIRKRVEGVISFPITDNGECYRQLDARGIPYVFIDKVINGFEADVFLLNNREISGAAVRKAINRGHRKIGILTGSKGVYSADERLQGYLDALQEAGIAPEERYIRRSVYNVQDYAINEAKALLQQENPPTVIFATNYFFTLGVIIALNDLKKKLGEDVALIGFDNILLTELIRPRLFMVAQPMEEYAVKATDLLLRRMNGETDEARMTRVCKGYLIEGETL